MTTTMKVQGAAEIEKLLKQLPERLAKSVTVNGLKAGGRVIAKSMKERVPVRTGKLRDSITVSSSKQATRQRANAVVGFKRPTSAIAHLVEFGTEHSAAKPFIRPAIDNDGEAAIRAIGEAMAKGLAKEATALAAGTKSFLTGKRI